MVRLYFRKLLFGESGVGWEKILIVIGCYSVGIWFKGMLWGTFEVREVWGKLKSDVCVGKIGEELFNLDFLKYLLEVVWFLAG